MGFLPQPTRKIQLPMNLQFIYGLSLQASHRTMSTGFPEPCQGVMMPPQPFTWAAPPTTASS